jgi:hypothetical protein
MVNNSFSDCRQGSRILHFLTNSLKSAAKILFCLDNQKASFTFLHKYFVKKGIGLHYLKYKNKVYGPAKMPFIGLH